MIAIQVFTASGVYTPSPSMTSCVIECVGGGGSGGNTTTTNASQVSGSAGGGGGGYAKKMATAAQIGLFQSVTIGAGGIASGAGGATGLSGNTTSVGALCAATGGVGGTGGGASAIMGGIGVAGGIGTVGDILLTGNPSGYFMVNQNPQNGCGSNGGGSGGGFGAGGLAIANLTGSNGRNYGGGGGGVLAVASTPQQAGGNGSSGCVVITEYGMTALAAGSAQGNVRYDLAQGLTASQQVQARQNIFAAPFDALATNGMQINGSADVSQENGTTQIFGGAGGTVINKYIADGWIVGSNGAQGISYAQSNSAIGAAPLGYSNYATVWINVVNAAPAANDYLFFSHPIEGYRIARLAWGTANAQPISIGFWFWASLAGTYSGAIRNAAANRSYAFSFTVSAGSTWQWITATIAGDSAGTWTKTNVLGLGVDFAMMAGSNYQTAAGVWTAGNYLAATGTFNGTAGGNYFGITGLIMLPGVELPSAARAPLIMRPYDQEVATCQRYWRATRSGTGIAYSTTQMRVFMPHFGMRAAPTISLAGVVTITDVYVATLAQSAATSLNAVPLADSSSIDFDSFAGLTSGRFYSISQASNLIKFDARL